MSDKNDKYEGRNKKGQFLKGNQLWQHAVYPGRPKIYKSPEDLWNACLKYFEWINDAPLLEEKAFHYQNEVTTHNSPKLRAMTKEGLTIFIGIALQTWENYKKDPEFLGVCKAVEQTIYNQKFEGAAAGLLNHAIIIRDLGLKEQVDHTTKGDKIETDTDATLELARKIAFGLRAAKESVVSVTQEPGSVILPEEPTGKDE